jgi:hypothetical protein
MTHEEYLDESGEAIQWMVRIDHIYRQIDAERKAKQRQG